LLGGSIQHALFRRSGTLALAVVTSRYHSSTGVVSVIAPIFCSLRRLLLVGELCWERERKRQGLSERRWGSQPLLLSSSRQLISVSSTTICADSNSHFSGRGKHRQWCEHVLLILENKNVPDSVESWDTRRNSLPPGVCSSQL
jgi:hypothetical protein